MIEVNITLLFQIVNFVIGLLIINHFIVKPLREVIAKRRAAFSSLEGDASGLDSKAKSKLVEYEARLQKVRAEVTNAREESKNQAFAKAQAINSDAADKAREIRTNAQEERVKASEAVYADLQSKTQEFATLATSRLLS